MKNDVQERKVLYAAVWRWHFYAGLYVAPFLMLLAVTGLVMLAKEPIERWQFGAAADQHVWGQSYLAPGETGCRSIGVSQCDGRALSARTRQLGSYSRDGHDRRSSAHRLR